ncbi:hypothetical protein IST495B_01750 [Burkholderia multivorans]|nr:hypothetical protein IST455B_01419 [Burkholderia multivorans]CAB5312501.1 hypothetical protein IST495B_01750 [Burkholderia multivorans]
MIEIACAPRQQFSVGQFQHRTAYSGVSPCSTVRVVLTFESSCWCSRGNGRTSPRSTQSSTGWRTDSRPPVCCQRSARKPIVSPRPLDVPAIDQRGRRLRRLLNDLACEVFDANVAHSRAYHERSAIHAAKPRRLFDYVRLRLFGPHHWNAQRRQPSDTFLFRKVLLTAHAFTRARYFRSAQLGSPPVHASTASRHTATAPFDARASRRSK